MSKFTTEYFIERALEKHCGLYDYSETKYVKSTQKIAITCKIHGVFYQEPNNHLKGQGCKKCTKPSTVRTFVCIGCDNEVSRRVRTSNDKGIYCSKPCGNRHMNQQRADLPENVKKRKEARKEAVKRILVRRESLALKRISFSVTARKAECDVCGKSHVRRYKFSRRCSVACDKMSSMRQKDSRRSYRKVWAKTDKGKAAKKAGKDKRRAQKRGVHAELINPFDIFDRDKWRCHICGIKTLKSLRGTYEDRAPELEHKIPLALGGTHTWDNVACSCRKCNNEKGATIMGQLGLVL